MLDVLFKYINDPATYERLSDPSKWKSLDVDYYPPRVERLYFVDGEFRFFIHVIHATDKSCLFHKHKWPNAVYILKGQYEMGITKTEYDQPDMINTEPYCKVVMTKDSYYEMCDRDLAHYVRPLTIVTYSLMVTGPLFPNPVEEVLDRELKPLSEERVKKILEKTKLLWPVLY